MKTNDKIFTIAMTLIIFATLFIACAPAKETPVERELYALTCEVVEVDRNSDTVTCEDYNGNLWEFFGAEDWDVGDCVSLLMNNSGTESIYDDEIVGATYGAWVLNK